MNNLIRALRLTLKHPFRLTLVAISALLVGLLWGANIGTVYPLMKVVLNGQPPAEWIASEISQAHLHATESRVSIAVIESRELSGAQRTARLDQARLTLQADPRLENQDRNRLLADLDRELQHPGELQVTTLEDALARVEAEEAAGGRFALVQEYLVPWMPDTAFKMVALVLGLLMLGTVLKGLLMVANGLLTASVVGAVTMRLRNEFYRRTLRMDQATFSRGGTADLMSRFTHDIESLSGGLRMLISSSLIEPLKMTFCLIGASLVSWRLAIFSLMVTPIGILLMRWLSRTLKKANRKAMEGMSRIYAMLEESFHGIAVVKAFTMERYERWRFHKENKAYFLRSLKIARYSAMSSPLMEWMGMLTISLTLLAGLHLAVNQTTHLLGIPLADRPPSISTLLLFYGLLAGTSDPARKLSGILGRVQQAAAAADRIFTMFDREPEIQDPPNPVRLPRHTRSIGFEHVSFAYTPGIPVLHDVSLEVKFGESVALVGPNGCGKSTLLNLLLRFYDPSDGRITVDGIDLRDVRVNELRDQIGMVTQEPILFNDTVYNNIRYGARRASQEDVVRAAKQAHAHRFITEKLSHGYESQVGERGRSISGGQRQRIALARAILRNPSILILDEATSQVDVESERLIHNVLEQFMRDRTALIVTHRASTLAICDRIVIMDHGRIVDQGTHDELIRRNPFYRELFREAA